MSFAPPEAHQQFQVSGSCVWSGSVDGACVGRWSVGLDGSRGSGAMWDYADDSVLPRPSHPSSIIHAISQYTLHLSRINLLCSRAT